jgi:carbon starvation protein
LLGVSVWLYKTAKRRYAWIITFIPAIWMFIISNWALLLLIRNAWYTNNILTINTHPIPVIAIILLLLSLTLASEVVYTIYKSRLEHKKTAFNP